MFPLLLIPLAIVNITAFLMPDSRLWETTTTVTLPSLQPWTFTYGDALIAFSLLLLILEIGKAARPGAKYFTDHFLALLIFLAAAAEFLMLPPFGHSTFLLLTVIAFVDLVGSILVRARRPKMVAAAAAPAVAPTAAPAVTTPAVAEPMPNPPAAAPKTGPVHSESVIPERTLSERNISERNDAAPVAAEPVIIVPPAPSGAAEKDEQADHDKRSSEPTVIPQR